MGKYYSPEGNYEVWEEKPDGYFTLEEWLELHPSELPEPYVPTPEELVRNFNFLIMNYLNKFAQTKQYDTIQNAMLMNSPDSTWEQDGKDAYAAYDLVWTEAIKLMPQIEDGTITPDEAMQSLPTLDWTL